MSVHTFDFEGRVVLASWSTAKQKFTLSVDEEQWALVDEADPDAGKYLDLVNLVDEEYDDIYELSNDLAKHSLPCPRNFLFDLLTAKRNNDSKFAEKYEVKPSEARRAADSHEIWRARQFLENYGRRGA